MSMFIEIFFVLCIMAQTQFCLPPQPGLQAEENPVESSKVDRKSTVLSRINDAGNCTAYKDLNPDPKNLQHVKEYCERPFPDKPGANAFFSYEVALCMALYDVAQRICEGGHQEVTKVGQSHGNFSCGTMIKVFPETSIESAKYWVTTLKTKFQNISICQQACIQGNLINPICEYILRANIFIQEAQMPSTISADKSPAENVEPQVNSQDHGKVKTFNTDKVSEKKSGLPSAAGSDHPIQNGSRKTEHIVHKTTATNESVHKGVDLAESNGNSTQSVSENDMQKNIKQKEHSTNSNMQSDIKIQAQTTNNTVHSNPKKQEHTADSNTQNGINAHSRNGSMEISVKEQPHATKSNSQSAEVTHHIAAVLLPENAEHTAETEQYDGRGKGVSSDSKIDTAPQSENKNSAGAYVSDPDIQNQSDGNEDSLVPTDQNYNKVQDTDITGDIPNDDEDQGEGRINLDNPGEQSEQITKETETHREGAEGRNTAQFNQLGDVDESHFYAYFMTMVVICIVGYLVFHNKQKILALALEGRSRRGTRRRPNTSAYRKLDSNLEEAVTSTGSTSVTHVIY